MGRRAGGRRRRTKVARGLHLRPSAAMLGMCLHSISTHAVTLWSWVRAEAARSALACGVQRGSWLARLPLCCMPTLLPRACSHPRCR